MIVQINLSKLETYDVTKKIFIIPSKLLKKVTQLAAHLLLITVVLYCFLLNIDHNTELTISSLKKQKSDHG